MTDQTDPISQLVTVKAQTGAPDIRRFGLAELNAMTEEVLSTVKPGEHGKAFLHLSKSGGVTLSMAGYLPKPGWLRFLPGKGDWTVYSSLPWSGDLVQHGLSLKDLEAGAVVRWSF